MGLLMVCEECSKRVSFPSSHEGKKGRCPICGAVMLIGAAPSDSTAASNPTVTDAAAPSPSRSEPQLAVAAPLEESPQPSIGVAINVARTDSNSSLNRHRKRGGQQKLVIPLVAAGVGAAVLLLAVGVLVIFSQPHDEEHVARRDDPSPQPQPTNSDLPQVAPPDVSIEDAVAEFVRKQGGDDASTDGPQNVPSPSPEPDPAVPLPRPEPEPEIQPPLPQPESPPEDSTPPVDQTNPPEPAPETPPTEPPSVPEDPIVRPESPAPVNSDPAPDADAHPLVTKTAKLLYIVRGKPKVLEDVTIAAIEDGSEPGSFASVSFRNAGEAESARPRQLPAEQIVRIVAEGDRAFDVRYDRSGQFHYLLDVEKHLVEVAKTLRAQGKQLWARRSDEEQAAAVAEYKEFFADVNEKFGGKLRLYETDYFLFYSDMAEVEARLSVEYLTAMYLKLSELFGVMPGDNVWRGKCVVVAFHHETDFHAFESRIMGNLAPQGKAGLHHGYSNGKSIISCMRGKNPAFYRVVLVHETVHGFLHRYRSSVHIQSWINEGIADWVAGAVVPDSDEVKRRQRSARSRLLQTRTLGPEFFQARNIDGDDYGTASDMADMMIHADPAAFRLLLDGIKEGQTWEESLQASFGVTPEQLAELYFRQRVVGSR